jgi:integrase
MPRKPRAEGTRAPNGAASIYLGSDGRWHGRVTVGVKDDGSPDRPHVSAKTEAEVLAKVRKLEKDRDAGNVRKSGKRWTVAAWLTHWVENIAAPSVRPNTLSGYRVAINKHLIPGLGQHRLERLQPEHLERFYAKMIIRGSAAGTAHQAHRTIRAALNEAVRRGDLGRNPVLLARAPRLTDTEIEPFTVDEVKALLLAAGRRRNAARWAVALALGLRQGEVLGLRWVDVKFDEGSLRVRRGRMRPTYAHGCDTPCGKRAGYCPKRVQTRPDADEVKSRAGRRTVGLPAPLSAVLKLHKEAQDLEREKACQLWHEGDWVFTDEFGRPVNPSTDYHGWKRLLRDAGLRDSRLHDARHTAATVLLILGVSERAVMGVMGWASTSMAARYQHVTDSIRADIAKRVGGLIWTPEDKGDDGTAGVPATVK